MRSITYTLMLLSWLMIALTTVACGDLGGDGTTGSSADACGADCDEEANPLAALPGDTLISSLSKSELIAFCERRQAAYSEFLILQTDPALNCTEQGLDLRFEEGQDIPACEAERSACIEEANKLPKATFDMLGCLPYQVSSTQMTECELSLDQYDECIDGLLAQAKALIDALHCSITIDEAARFQAQDNTDMPDACNAVALSCPPLQAELDVTAE